VPFVGVDRAAEGTDFRDTQEVARDPTAKVAS